MLELHCHTTYSDGTLSPQQLVEAAVKAGVRALAITDHDTMMGWDEAIAAAPEDLEIIPGLELSTVHNHCSLHILGFYPNRHHLQPPLQDRIEGRKRRAQKMVEKLADLGYPIELPELSDGIAPGRPHIAAALVKAGHVQSSREAFDRWLGDKGPAYVGYEKFSIQEGIALLRSCGAVPVWAHPYLFRGGELETVLRELIAAGLMGVEVYHPTHHKEQIEHLKRLCCHYNLLMTGGSDYHGPSPDGTVLNQMNVSLELLEPLKQAAASLS